MRENDFLSWVIAQSLPHPAVTIPIGDDMAAVNLPASTGGSEPLCALALLKIDQALDKVHFDLDVHTPRAVGRKAVNRCFSDCAAMACEPAAIVISVALPRDATETLAQELFLGCRDAAAEFDCPVVGGDTGIWDQRMAITIAAVGKTDGPVVTRAGAIAGDLVCVSGGLGGSILGRHMTFEPRIKLARALARRVSLHAMMDLSDGLLADLPRLCARSGVGARVWRGAIPIHEDAVKLAERDRIDAYTHALADGEDYELLFTLDKDDWRRLKADSVEDKPLLEGVPLKAIGEITEQTTLLLLDENGRAEPWPQGGWEHRSGGVGP